MAHVCSKMIGRLYLRKMNLTWAGLQSQISDKNSQKSAPFPDFGHLKIS